MDRLNQAWHLQVDSRAAEVYGGDESLCGMEAEGAVTEHADLVVGALQASIRESGLDGQQDAVEMSANRLGEADEGSES